MPLASSLQKTAKKLIRKFGGDVTFRVITVGAYNPATGEAGETASDVAIKGVLEEVNEREVGDLIQSGDKRLLVAALDLTNPPTVADRVVISSVSYQVIFVNTVEQDNQAITHELILRG